MLYVVFYTWITIIVIIILSLAQFCLYIVCYHLVCLHLSNIHTRCNFVIFSIASETPPITAHPTNINRAHPNTSSCSDAQPRAEGKRQKRALLRNELCYLCYPPPQLGPARHNNVVTAIDAFPQLTELMEWVSKSVTYFLHPASQCMHTLAHTSTYQPIQRAIQSKAII